MDAPLAVPSFTPAERACGVRVVRVIWFLNGLTLSALAAWCI